MQIVADIAVENNQATRMQKNAGACEDELSLLHQGQALSPNSLPHPRAGAEDYPGFQEAPHMPTIVAMILERKELKPQSQWGLKLEG